MVELGVATVRFRYPDLGEEELRRLAIRLFESAEETVRARIRLDETAVVVELEVGTLKVRSRIFAGAVAVGTFLAAYGSVREGAVALGKDIYTVGSFLVQQIPQRAGADHTDVISTRRSATLTRRIESILRQVERGELDSETALHRLLRVLQLDRDGIVDETLIDVLEKDVALARNRGRRTELSPVSTPEQLPFWVTEEFMPPGRGELRPGRPRERPYRPKRVRVERELGSTGNLRIVED